MIGKVPAGQAVLRSGARPGDVVLVSGWIGDGWLGLQAALGRAKSTDEASRASVLGRYLTPEPRVALSGILRRYAHAAADVSDGLIADAGHIARAAAVAVELGWIASPCRRPDGSSCPSARTGRKAMLRLATGGDD